MEGIDLTLKSPNITCDQLLVQLAEKNTESVLQRMQKINQQQKFVDAILDGINKDIEKSDFQIIIGQRIVNSTTFRSKLQMLRISMFKISERSTRLQSRLNFLRKECPPQNALVEPGPFHYRCVYKGGVRYREYPSSTARVTGNVLTFNSVVVVAERVFITGEISVYLHIKGVGWLFENKDGLVCMERCSDPNPFIPPVNRTKDISGATSTVVTAQQNETFEPGQLKSNDNTENESGGQISTVTDP